MFARYVQLWQLDWVDRRSQWARLAQRTSPRTTFRLSEIFSPDDLLCGRATSTSTQRVIALADKARYRQMNLFDFGFVARRPPARTGQRKLTEYGFKVKQVRRKRSN